MASASAPLVGRTSGPSRSSASTRACWTRRSRWGGRRAGPNVGASSSLLSLYSHRDAWANLHLLGQPDTFLASAAARGAVRADGPAARAGARARAVRSDLLRAGGALAHRRRPRVFRGRRAPCLSWPPRAVNVDRAELRSVGCSDSRDDAIGLQRAQSWERSGSRAVG